ncbi:RNA-directed DNA polymerase from mobile element jockey-like, partial [Paramuricea clavata]
KTEKQIQDPPKFLEVTEERVQKVLEKLNPHKAPGPDNLPNWIFKEYSYLLALPVMKIINASYYEQQLPTIWKKANISPLPKKKPVTILEKDLRPISLTPCISKVAEEFIVEDYVKPAILDIIDASQYGAIPNSSTTMALISMLHHWFINTDGNGATIRTILFDYRKAFDFIDHTILVKKLGNLNIPRSIINWIIDFLSHRTQRVKLADSCFSEWGLVPSGVPQGTKLGPWLFILMIQDLNINSPYMWKFVDDTTASEILPKGNVSTAQNIADYIKQWSEENRLKLHPDKCKELRISFSKDPVVLDQVILNGKEVEIVESAKLLGVTISNNLTWHAHIKEVVKKASKRLYYLVQLKRARLP